MSDQRPILPPDDSLDEQIAEEIAAEACARHPQASPELRDRYVRLFISQFLGDVSPPGLIGDEELAQHQGRDRRRVSEDAARTLRRIRLQATPTARALARAYLLGKAES